MKLKITISIMLFCGVAQADPLVYVELRPEFQSNAVVTVDYAHPKPCPPEYVNITSNTNLFTPTEQMRIRMLRSKYSNVTTNIGPEGTVFKGIEWHQWKYNGRIVDKCQVSRFVYPSTGTSEEI